MVDSVDQKPEFSSLLDSERRIKNLRMELNDILDLLVESNSFVDRVQKVYQRSVGQLRSAIAVKIKAALPNELMEHEKGYLEAVADGKNRSLIDIKFIIDIEGSLKIRKEYIQKNDSEETILDEVKFRKDLSVAINNFLQEMTSMNFTQIAVMVRGYIQIKKTHKKYYSFDLNNCDLQLLPICTELDKYFDKYLNSLIKANTKGQEDRINISNRLLTELNNLQKRIYSIAENLK